MSIVLTGHDAVLDDCAHAEIMHAPGFVDYFKGPATEDGHGLPFCLWNSRAQARAASGRPAHVAAAPPIHWGLRVVPS